MERGLFNQLDYRKYIEFYYTYRSKPGHGFKSRLAEALGCNSAYISQVFNKGANFSLEQAEILNHLFQHTKEESRYFLLLVQYARAGSLRLKARIKELIDEANEKRLNLKERTGIKNTLSESDQAKYYSAWYFAAVHMIVTIEKLQTRETIAEHLHLPAARVAEVLEFLISIGLIEEEKGKYKTGVNRLFLGKDSPMISKHHSNWRIRAIDSLEKDEGRDLHYSTLFTYNKKDSQKIKERLSQAIDDVRAIVKESANEDEISCMNLDFFELKN